MYSVIYFNNLYKFNLILIYAALIIASTIRLFIVVICLKKDCLCNFMK